MDKNVASDVMTASRELGQSFTEAASLLSGMNEGMAEVNSLYDHGYGSAGKSLISLGVALVIFPEPFMVSDVIGCGIIAAGLAYNKINPPPMYIDNIFETIEEQMKTLHSTGENLIRNFTVPVDFSSMHLDF